MYDHAFIISRGYGRQSKGLVEVSIGGHIGVDVSQSGDEAMLMAQSLPKASIIVSENREVAILRAKELGAKVIFLDDGFNRVEIKKFEILLEPQKIHNFLPLPSGAFREFYFSKYFAHLRLKENREFQRMVSFENPSPKMLLVTAISNPSRLDLYLPTNVVDRLIFADHEYFDLEKIKNRMKSVGATSILVTQKDFVKLGGFEASISLMKLDLEIDASILESIKNYIQSFKLLDQNHKPS